mmetsp:Transcript_13815/g.28504  ORF Transcript_13815/g.28504 Transcript_13815/m.28504 type:complete len:365 (-) Transcript_13815:173-1267(-)
MSIKSDEATVPSDAGDNEVSLTGMKNAFQQEINDNGKKKTVWSMTMETMGMASGKDGSDDLWLETVEQGVSALKQYVREKDLQLAEEQATAEKKLPFNSWMDLVPLEEFHVSQSTFLKAFIKWATKDQEDIVEGSTKNINASKARRRLDSYFDWMKDNMAEDLAENPLTLDSIMPVQKAWELQGSYDKQDRYVWWFDLGKMDLTECKTLDPHLQLRYMVWWSHLVMFDAKAQDNGIVLLEDLDKIGFWSAMTIVPMELSTKMDRLTIGVLPVKMKGIYMFGAAKWMHIMLALMKPFLSKKMRERMVNINDGDDRDKFCSDLLDSENIPDGFVQLKGTLEHNAAIEKFKKRAKKKAKKASMKEKA